MQSSEPSEYSTGPGVRKSLASPLLALNARTNPKIFICLKGVLITVTTSFMKKYKLKSLEKC